MKHLSKYMIMLLAFLVPLLVRSQQTNSQNYVISKIYKQAGANENDVSQVITQVRYIDGLGRPLQNVGVKQSPTGNDLVQPIEYDNMGRKAKDYLPYVAAGNGAYQANGLTTVAGWYTANSAGLQKLAANDLDRPFTETYFEQSFNRPSGGRAPDSRSANSSIQYSVNAANEVKRYDYSVGANTIAQNGTYSVGTLIKVQDTDEQGIVTSQYMDKSGQLICKYEPATGYTYYVFDNRGLLRGVLQPKFQDDANFGNYAFLYDYDSRNRVVRKQIPGAGAVEIVYDKFDRPALSRDANQLARNVWGFTKYDSLNRPLATGEIASTDTRALWVTTMNAIVTHHETRNNAVIAGYSLNQTAPTGANESNLLTITFYDDYAFSKPAGWAFVPTYYPGFNGKVKGEQTGGRVRMLPGNGAVGGWLSTVTYYDTEYRPIQSLRQLHDLGATAYERISIKYKYDLASVVEEQKTEQVLSGAITHTHLATYTYDHGDRMLSVKEKISTGTKTKEVFTVAQRYNDLGQLQSKWLHAYGSGTKYRRRIDFTNNIRGWQTDAKTVYKPAAAELPFYATHVSYRNGANYSNGSVDSLAWRGKDENAFSAGLKFTYDGASRLTGSTGIFGNANTESGISYDKNGNVTTLTRSGVAVDNLIYTYVGNRLSVVGDASGDNTGVKNGGSNYLYDANGNMLSDGNRGATLTYNYLNLPKTITIGANPALTYDYDASGAKHKYANSADAFIAKYAGIIEYDGSNAFKRAATSEGQAILTSDSLTFNYYIKDHLGNVRIVFNENGEVLQNTEYYPFGLAIAKDSPIQTPAARNSVNRYLYNEKELQVGSGYLDYGARMYMPEIGRWGTADPLSDISRRFSPYTYGNDNPLRFIDPDGRLAGESQKGILQRIFDFLGLFQKPKSQEEAATYANRQERFNETVGTLERASDDLKSKAEWVPFLGAITDISQGAVKKDNTQVVLGMASLVGDALPGEGKLGFTLTKHGELTNGVYTVSQEAMKKHLFGSVQGKSVFYPYLNASEAVLKAAQYADEAGLWIGNKAKVPVINTSIGTLGNGQPTYIINVYRNSNGFIHGSPGSIR
ncbi:MAG: DUF6443 domain-containing protein [Dyadobacter sp.]|uniref:RHS repeat domain-containing protein n=1 Tax=Dyadobacter sp. TaxID=1914288 RepID=UPI003264A795